MKIFERCPKCKKRLNRKDRIFRFCSNCKHDLAIIEGRLKKGEKTKGLAILKEDKELKPICNNILSKRVKVPNEHDHGQFTDLDLPEDNFTKKDKKSE
ncbi:MAG: hypothetical protein ACFFDF_23400 [Candidatus Odinarchaeota archaeon]